MTTCLHNGVRLFLVEEGVSYISDMYAIGDTYLFLVTPASMKEIGQDLPYKPKRSAQLRGSTYKKFTDCKYWIVVAEKKYFDLYYEGELVECLP